MGRRKKGNPWFPLFWAVLLTLGACASPLTELVPDYAAMRPTRIAVLPAINETADMDGPVVFRILVQAELADKGYALAGFDQIDQALLTKGIEEGGQVESLTSQELGELLEVDAVLYTRVMGYGRQVGVHIKMEGSFTLVDCKSNRKLWYSELSTSDDILLEGGAVVLAAKLLGGKDAEKKAMEAYLAARQARLIRAVTKFRFHPLRNEVFQVITADMEKIPLLDEFFTKNFATLPRP